MAETVISARPVEAAGDETLRPDGRRRLSSVPGVVAFAALVVATIPTYVSRLDGYEFRGDDWRLFLRGGTFGDYFEHYNQHLSVVPIATYRFLLEVFGLGSTLPLRVVAVLSLAAAAVAMFLVVRARLGASVALVAGAALLWYPRLQLTPSAFNHWLALTAVIVLAWALARSDRSFDWVVAAALGFALCSSGVGLAGAVGAAVYVVLTRPHLRRWLVVSIPSAIWGVWWLLEYPEQADPRAVKALFPEASDDTKTISDTLRAAAQGALETFERLALGNRILACLLVVAFVALLVLRLRSGLRAAAAHLAWTGAFLFWWVGLADSRGTAAAHSARYQLVGSAFLMLALLPSADDTRWRTRLARPEVAGLALVLASLLVYANHDEIFGHARLLEQTSRAVRQRLVAANLGPEVVPDDARVDIEATLNPTAGAYRELTAEHGVPQATRTDDPDARIVALGPIRPRPERGRPGATCLPLGSESTLPPAATVVLRAEEQDVEVQLRRFGDRWIVAGSIPKGSTGRLELPGLSSPVTWQLRAEGACRVKEGRAVSVKQTGSAEGLSGTVSLAATVENWYVTEVEFRLRGTSGGERVLGAGVKFVKESWVLQWDTTSVPDGDYVLTAVVSGPDGFEDTSRGLRVTVDNP